MEDAIPLLNTASPGGPSFPSPSGDPGTKELLSHLLNIEAEAAALVNEAQAEADRRVGEGEKTNRSRYEEQYGREAAALESACVREIAEAKAAYARELDAYRDSLHALRVDTGAFAALMTEFSVRE
jgi:hypothetical protein